MARCRRARIRTFISYSPLRATPIPDFPKATSAGDPLELFRAWFAAASAAQPQLPEAACLATATRDGAPSARMVLLKGLDERGFVFFTNYESRKDLLGREELERRFAEVDLRFQGRHVPLPPYWGGYRIAPLTMEFWQGRANRLHDRLVFTRDQPEGPWHARHLYP
jgi:pyridoxamine 5'-phosphate oxidase